MEPGSEKFGISLTLFSTDSCHLQALFSGERGAAVGFCVDGTFPPGEKLGREKCFKIWTFLLSKLVMLPLSTYLIRFQRPCCSDSSDTDRAPLLGICQSFTLPKLKVRGSHEWPQSGQESPGSWRDPGRLYPVEGQKGLWMQDPVQAQCE